MSKQKVHQHSLSNYTPSKKSSPFIQTRPWTNPYQQKNDQIIGKPAYIANPPTTEEWQKNNILQRVIETRQAQLQLLCIRRRKAKITTCLPLPTDKREIVTLTNNSNYLVYLMCKELSNLPNTELWQELYFHMKGLYWDITSLVKKMEEILLISANTSPPLPKIESLMSDVASETEHDATYHLAEALKLAGKLLENQSLVETGEYLASQEMDWKRAKQPPDDGEIDDLARLNQELQQLTTNLRLSLDIVNQVVNRQEKVIKWEQLEDKLTQLAEVLGTRSWTDVQKMYGQACRLERAANPEKYTMEDYLEMLATPLHEIYHPSARSLNFCPSCGTPLTGDDRTFVGSYCEVCRTAWIEFSDDN